MSEVFDNIIIGAGLSGCSVAYWLRQTHPEQKTLLIDRLGVAAEASGQNAGFVTNGSLAHLKKLMDRFGADQAYDIWQYRSLNHGLLATHFLKQITHLNYRRSGSLSLAKKESTLNNLAVAAQLLQDHHLRVQAIDQDELTSRFDLHGFAGGFLYSGDGSVDPVTLIEHIFRRSATPLHKREVLSIEKSSKQWTLETNDGIYKSHRLYLCTNAFLPKLLPAEAFHLIPTRAQMLETDAIPRRLDANLYSCDEMAYLRQTAKGTFVAGGFRQLDPDSEVGFRHRIHNGIQQNIQNFVVGALDWHPVVQRRWSGIMGFTQDGLPGAGPIDKDMSGYFMAGFSGHGMGTAFLLAKQLVDYSQHQEPIFKPFYHQIQAF